MKYSQYKDNLIRHKFNKYESKKRILKSILYTSLISIDNLNNSLNNKEIQNNINYIKNIKKKALISLNKLPRSSSIVRIKNRCIITGRSRSVYKDFKISRIILNNLALNGLMPGLTKSSW